MTASRKLHIDIADTFGGALHWAETEEIRVALWSAARCVARDLSDNDPHFSFDEFICAIHEGRTKRAC